MRTASIVAALRLLAQAGRDQADAYDAIAALEESGADPAGEDPAGGVPRMLVLAYVAKKDLGWGTPHSNAQARRGHVPGAVRRGRRWFVSADGWAKFLGSGKAPGSVRKRPARAANDGEATPIDLLRGVELAAARRAGGRRR